MSEVLLQLGDPAHAVNRHGSRLAAAAAVPVTTSAAGLPPRVHLELTDRLLAADGSRAVPAARDLLSSLGSREIWVGLHDVPDEGDDAWTARRRPLYALLADRAARCVVASETEAARLRRLAPAATPHVVPLPVARRETAPVRPPESVTVLGFVWPGRGHQEVVAAARAAGLPVRCVGRAAPGHDLGDLAADDVEVTGWVDDPGAWLTAPTVPVAPNRRVSASASICDWWAYGRRPLVPRTDYALELVARDPGCVLVYDDLSSAVAAAVAGPASTYLAADERPGLDVGVAAALRFGR